MKPKGDLGDSGLVGLNKFLSDVDGNIGGEKALNPAERP